MNERTREERRKNPKPGECIRCGKSVNKKHFWCIECDKENRKDDRIY